MGLHIAERRSLSPSGSEGNNDRCTEEPVLEVHDFAVHESSFSLACLVVGLNPA
jgi:hypothetical protein